MQKKVAVVVAPNWHDYAKKYLVECVHSLRIQDYSGEIKFFITDNETSSESFEFLKNNFPEAELVLNKDNDGFAKGNNDSIRVALMQGFEYIVLVNMDTTVDKSFISELVNALEKDEKIGAAQSRIMLYSEPGLVNSLGNDTYFLGFGYCRGYRDKYEDEKIKDLQSINYFSGAGVIIRANVLKEVGLFDEKFWMYNEDQDLGLKIWLSGYKCVLAKKSIVYHKYSFAKSIKQYYWMDRNRIIMLLKIFKIPTLVLIFPAFLVMELGLIAFSRSNGWWPEKKKVWKYFFSLENWSYILSERRQIQKNRKVNDSFLASMITGRIMYQEIDDIKLRLVNPIFNLYWQICKFLIIW